MPLLTKNPLHFTRCLLGGRIKVPILNEADHASCKWNRNENEIFLLLLLKSFFRFCLGATASDMGKVTFSQAAWWNESGAVRIYLLKCRWDANQECLIRSGSKAWRVVYEKKKSKISFSIYRKQRGYWQEKMWKIWKLWKRMWKVMWYCCYLKGSQSLVFVPTCNFKL